MVMANVTKKVGRPQKYGPKVIKALKSVVRLHGLIAGRDVILAKGVIIGGKRVDINISLPTLSKYVKSEQGGTKGVKLVRGGDRRSEAARSKHVA
jgi:hypothetical protein